MKKRILAAAFAVLALGGVTVAASSVTHSVAGGYGDWPLKK